MLEIRNLTKVYRSKTGEEVRALDNVSISFPETGMVFILGKSGSGKSTLLNIMGGLDNYDSGEFVIKGKSSKDFGGSDFDAYRNTFIGFIFQEYNVLDDFTVGANIGLALELQGKKASSERIGEILGQVDLLSFAKRKPNELSGGQKQRVAIARALVKDPQIIMADEPTGALDSNTGKQIFDTLKNLSREKLVLIVSHDRDFAERYADRIVELSDGQIISDVTKHEHESEKLTEGIDKISGQILRIRNGYRLTATDLQMINDYLSQSQGDVILSGDNRVNEELRSAAGISEKGTTSVFEGTTEVDYTLKKYEKKDSSFIRSRLPIKNALRMGSSGLKHKKFRLVMTIFLSLLAFALFGFADTLAGYNPITGGTDSVIDSNVKNASVTVNVRRTTTTAKGETYYSYEPANINREDLEYLRQTTGLNFVPVFTGGDKYGFNGGFSVVGSMQNYSSDSKVYTGKIHGMVAMSEEDIASSGFTVIGRLPEADGEIAITELMYRQFNAFGFQNNDKNETIAAGSVVKEEGSPNSIIGKHITLSGDTGMFSVKPTYKIVGIVDTQFDYDRYQSFLPKENDNMPQLGETEENALTDMVLSMEIESEMNYGFHGLAFMTEQDIESAANIFGSALRDIGTYMSGWNKEAYILVAPSAQDEGEQTGNEHQLRRVAGSSALSALSKSITWVDGVERTTLGPNEVLIHGSVLRSMTASEYELNVKEVVDAEAGKIFGEAAWNESAAGGGSYWGRMETLADQQNPPMERSVLREKAIAIAEKLYKIDVPADLPTTASDALLDVFYSTEDSNPVYRLQSYNIDDMLRRMYGNYDIEKNALWQNQEFVDLMLGSEYMRSTGVDWDQINEDQKRHYIRDFYIHSYLVQNEYGYENNPYGKYSGQELSQMAEVTFANMTGITLEDLAAGIAFTFMEQDMELDHSALYKSYDFKIVGIFEDDMLRDVIINDTVLADYREWDMNQMPQEHAYTEEYAEHENGIWAYVLAPMGQDRGVIEQLVRMHHDEGGDLKFQMHNPIIDTLDTFNEFIEIGSKVFLYVGIGFAVFSALLLMNFIATSISYKKREIGVLRAVGARSSDVFKIFFSEALIIALINFILSTAVVIAATVVTNTLMHNNGINVTLLSYGIRQFVLMLLVSVGVALLSSFLPVYNIAKKKPVDAIKDR